MYILVLFYQGFNGGSNYCFKTVILYSVIFLYFYLFLIVFNERKTQGILLSVAYNNTCYSKNVLVQPYTISDMVITRIWKIALENDLIKSKHVVIN
jgi:hypothetical protein